MWIPFIVGIAEKYIPALVKKMKKKNDGPHLLIEMQHLGEVEGYAFPCPGCGYHHYLPTNVSAADGRRWTWNGDEKNPTFNPSHRMTVDNENGTLVCHVSVLNGHLDFFHDSTHKLAGRIVPMTVMKDGHEMTAFFT